MTRLLIISHDIIGERMAGVGIRYWEIARALAQDAALQVTLAAPSGSAANSNFGGQFMAYDENLSGLDEAIACSDVILAYPDMIWRCRAALSQFAKPVVVDGYDITLLEHLALDHPAVGLRERLTWHAEYQRMMAYVLERGDFFLAATERQRDWWLGMLAAAGRINPLTYRADPTLRQLVNVLPYGLPDDPPTHTRPVMRSVIEGIGPQDRIVLWGGGAWEWLDPLTLIRAAAQIASRRSDVKFVFPGVRHPAHPPAQTMPVQQQVIELAASLGLLNRMVFLGDWVAYEDWPSYLLESDIGVSLHHDHLEAHFSARTRVLSYLWAGLPMVLTRGDVLAERMAQAGIARLVAENDASAVAIAIEDLLAQPRSEISAELSALRSTFQWSKTVQALRSFCLRPTRAPDRSPEAATAIAEPESKPATESSADLRSETSAPAIHQPTMKRSFTLPELELAQPASFLARLLSPLLDALVFWRLKKMIWQQNQINRSLLDTLSSIQSAVADLAGQQQHTHAVVMDLAGQQQHTHAVVMDLAGQQQHTHAVVMDLAGQQQHTHAAMAHLAERLTDAEHLQTDLIAEIAKQ